MWRVFVVCVSMCLILWEVVTSYLDPSAGSYLAEGVSKYDVGNTAESSAE